MSGFTRRAKGLEQTFPLSGPSLHEPGELSEFVQLVHQVFGPLQRIGSNERQQTQNLGVGVIVTVTQAPQGVVRLVEYCQAFHDDAAARTIHFRLLGPTGNAVVIQASDADGGATVPANTIYPLKRSIALGPGEILQARAVALGGAATLTVDVIYIDYSAADVAAVPR